MYKILNYLIATVWLINGLYCKVLNFIPRHGEIVSRILGEQHSRILTILIGFSEIMMALWILSGIKTKLNAMVQIIVIALMNILEFILVPELLLWKHYNLLFAALFIVLIYFNEFYLKSKTLKI